MGIDRIGKGAPPVALPEPSAPSGTRAAGEPFGVPDAAPAAGTRSDPGRVAGPAPAVASAPAGAPDASLERLRAGEIDLGGYLDAKVGEATAHLQALPPAELEAIRSVLRDRLANDPSFSELVQAAARAARPPGDE
jgi:hypothetical protein